MIDGPRRSHFEEKHTCDLIMNLNLFRRSLSSLVSLRYQLGHFQGSLTERESREEELAVMEHTSQRRDIAIELVQTVLHENDPNGTGSNDQSFKRCSSPGVGRGSGSGVGGGSRGIDRYIELDQGKKPGRTTQGASRGYDDALERKKQAVARSPPSSKDDRSSTSPPRGVVDDVSRGSSAASRAYHAAQTKRTIGDRKGTSPVSTSILTQTRCLGARAQQARAKEEHAAAKRKLNQRTMSKSHAASLRKGLLGKSDRKRALETRSSPDGVLTTSRAAGLFSSPGVRISSTRSASRGYHDALARKKNVVARSPPEEERSSRSPPRSLVDEVTRGER